MTLAFFDSLKHRVKGLVRSDSSEGDHSTALNLCDEGDCKSKVAAS